MSDKKIVIVLDVGAMNVRAVAVDETGNITAQRFFQNQTHPDPELKGGLIWDVDEIWGKLVSASKEILTLTDVKNVIAVTVTTFGVDFAPVSETGELLYPVISWACKRTEPVMANIGKYIPLEKLYSITGINKFSFNTINKLIWFKENNPGILDKADHFAFISSIFLQKLNGKLVTEATMAGTSMLTDLQRRDFSQEVFDHLGVDNKFPDIVESGHVAGYVTKEAAGLTGLPQGIPVIAAGHDTQFAIFGSGAGVNEPVLSSGTWEILMVRTPEIELTEDTLKAGVTTELDAVAGIKNPGIQWLGSGILEWIKKSFYPSEANDQDIYDLMIKEARLAEKSNVMLDAGFLAGRGRIDNLDINTKRGEIYRAALGALSEKLKTGLILLEESCGFKADSLIVVGGGAKNALWNELRSEKLGIDVKTVPQAETTVLGAAIFAFAGAGVFGSAEEAGRLFLK